MTAPDALPETDDYPLREASFVSCHAKVGLESQAVCPVCGDVSDLPGCPLGREVLP